MQHLLIFPNSHYYTAIVINNVLEHGELRYSGLLSNYCSISLSIASSSRGSRYLIDLKSKCRGENNIWWIT